MALFHWLCAYFHFACFHHPHAHWEPPSPARTNPWKHQQLILPQQVRDHPPSTSTGSRLLVLTAVRSEQACGAKGPQAQVVSDSDWDSDCLGSVLGWLMETLTAPQLVHQLVPHPHVLQIGPCQVHIRVTVQVWYHSPSLVYPRWHSRCTVLPARHKCQIR